MPATTVEQSMMREAISLAEKGMGRVEPNPMVGCVIAHGDRVIGRGYHQRFGGPHAEVEALASCGKVDPRGATAYVTLEPCCHQGKTPPCTDALIAAGIERVVIGMQDPFPRVDGGGLAKLQQAGIATQVGLLESEAEQLNAPYLKRVRHGLPWVIAKWAMTVDGRIATATGQSQWITSPASREQVHRLRGRVDAVAVGVGTALADDPMLTARPPGERTATRVVFCASRLPGRDSKLIRSAEQVPVMLVVDDSIAPGRLEPLRQPGVEIVPVPAADRAEMVSRTLSEFGRREMTNVMVEGGAEMLASFFEAGQIDECHLYIGAKAFGGKSAPGPIGGQGIVAIDDALGLRLVSMDRFDDDVRVVYRKISRR